LELPLAIYVELHPETKAGIAGAIGKHGAVANLAIAELVERFTADTAAATGKSERAVQRDAERGEKPAPIWVRDPPAHPPLASSGGVRSEARPGSAVAQ
jgi:hypothetical protein